MIDWKGERMIDTQGGLADVTSRSRVVRHLDDGPYEPEVCLCPVDVRSLLLSLENVEWRHDNGIPEYVVTRPNKAE